MSSTPPEKQALLDAREHLLRSRKNYADRRELPLAIQAVEAALVMVDELHCSRSRLPPVKDQRHGR